MTSAVRKFAFVLLWLLILTGIYLRFVDLGKWPLTLDEYYFAQSVFNLIENGLPKFPCGGYYTRGFLQQYLTAPFLFYSSDPEWALRLVPVLFNLLAFPAVYLLARRLGGNLFACVVTAFFSLSIVEIEMARFARMYAPFQALMLWQLYFLSLYLQERKKWAFIWIASLAGISILVYEGAIFMVLIVLVPFVIERRWPTKGQILSVLLLIVFLAISQFVDFRQLGVDPVNDLADIKIRTRQISLAPMMVLTLFYSVFWSVLFAGLLFLFIRAFFHLLRCCRQYPVESVGMLLVLICAVLNQFLLAFLMALLFALGSGLSSSRRPEQTSLKLEPIVSFVVISFFFWILYGYFEQQLTSIQIAKIIFGSPDLYNKIIVPWFSATPVASSMLLILYLLGVLACLKNRSQTEYLLKLFVTISLGVFIIVGLLKTTYTEARYTFFIYPVVLIISLKMLTDISKAISSKSVINGLIATTLIALFALVSEDYEFRHLKNISSPEINYRTIYKSPRKRLYYPRRDYFSPADFINQHRNEEDLVITLVPVIDFYLDRVDYRFESYQSGRFRLISACGGTRELWSHLPLVSSVEKLLEMIDQLDKTVWILAYSETKTYRMQDEILIAEKFSDYLVFSSIDTSVNVYKIPYSAAY